MGDSKNDSEDVTHMKSYEAAISTMGVRGEGDKEMFFALFSRVRSRAVQEMLITLECLLPFERKKRFF